MLTKTEAEKKIMYLRDTYISNYGAVALYNVGAIVTFEHNIQVHKNPFVLILVSCATHLLKTDTHRLQLVKKYLIFKSHHLTDK